MQKPKRKIKDSFSLITMLKQDSIDAINNFLKKSGSDNQYTKKIVGKNIRVIRTRKRFKFWKKLMETPPGSNKRGGE